MGQYEILKAAIEAVIKENGNNEITGEILQSVLLSMVNSLGAGYQFIGVATTSTNPGTPDQNVFYIASQPGTYSNFGLTVDDGEVAVFKWAGSWSKETTEIASNGAVYDAELVAREVDAKLRVANINDSFLPQSPSLVPVFAPFYLKGGRQYRFSAVFDSHPTQGAQVNLYIVPAITLSGAISSLYLYESSWSTEKSAVFTPSNDGMFAIVYRYIGSVVPGANISVNLDNALYLSELESLANYRISSGAFPLGDLLVGKTRGDDGTLTPNLYRLCTDIFRLSMPRFRVSCNYSDGYSYYLYVKRGGVFTDIAYNVSEDKEFNLSDEEFYLAVRALNGRAVTDADVAACGLSVHLLDDSYRIVPDVNAEIDSFSRLVLGDYVADEQFVPTSTATVAGVSPDFFMKHGREYTMRAQWDARPTDDVQVNIWVYKSGQTSGLVGRIIMRGGEDWQDVLSTRFVPQEDGMYYISYRVISGGAQTASMSVSVDNPLIAQPVESEEMLPAYYFPYIENRVADAKREMAKCGAGSVAAFLISDTHQPQNFGMSGKMLRYLNERLQVYRMLYGGDICPSLTSLWGGAADTAEDGIALSDNAITQLLSNVRGRIYRVKGNHDYSLANFTYWLPNVSYNVGDIRVWASSYSQGADNKAYRCIVANSDATFDPTKWELYGEGGAELSQIQTQRLILADAEAAGDCEFPDNSKASYYYFDIPRAKLRVICWDCCDSDVGFTGISDVREYISDAQFKWMAAAILATPAGYDIVSFGHIPAYINQSVGTGAYQTAAWNLTKRDFYAAVNGRGTFTIGGETFNFAGVSAKIIIEIAGHTHADCITNIGGMFAISIAGDWWTDFTKYSPVYYHFGITSLASRVGGTTREQAFDLVVFDRANGYIKFVRFGAGVDRWLNLSALSVSSGNTLQIETDLTGPVEYYVYDSDLRAQDPDGHYRPTSTRASINENGLMTAISSGGVVVMAYDTENRIVEIFGVQIS